MKDTPHRRIHGIINRMPYPEPVPIRERIRRTLTTATQPLTTRTIAETVGTRPEQAARALRRLESDGHAACRPAAGGCYEWWSTVHPNQQSAAPVSPCAAAGRCDAAAPGTR